METRDRRDHAEPEADTRLVPAGIATIKALHHLALFAVGDAGPGIRHADNDIVAGIGELKHDLAPGG